MKPAQRSMVAHFYGLHDWWFWVVECIGHIREITKCVCCALSIVTLEGVYVSSLNKGVLRPAALDRLPHPLRACTFNGRFQRRTTVQTLHGTAIYAYIGVVLGVNVGMECLGTVQTLGAPAPCIRSRFKMIPSRRKRNKTKPWIRSEAETAHHVLQDLVLLDVLKYMFPMIESPSGEYIYI